MPNSTIRTSQSASNRTSKTRTHGTSPTGGHKNKGRSKYSGKARSKQSVKPAKPSGPVFTYTSVCCSAPSTKPACTKASKVKGAPPQSLGTWRCTQCKKACKVTVSKYKAPEPLVKQSTAKLQEVLVPLNTPVLTDGPTVIITTEVPLG